MSTPGTSLARKEGANSQCQPRSQLEKAAYTEIEDVVGGGFGTHDHDGEAYELKYVRDDGYDESDFQPGAGGDGDFVIDLAGLLRRGSHTASIGQRAGNRKVQGDRE